MTTYIIHTTTDKAVRTQYANENKFNRSFIVKGDIETVKAFIAENSLNVKSIYNKSGRKVTLSGPREE